MTKPNPYQCPACGTRYVVPSIARDCENKHNPPSSDPGADKADQYAVDSHAEKQQISYADAWRHFERQGYDMSEVDGQYE